MEVSVDYEILKSKRCSTRLVAPSVSSTHTITGYNTSGRFAFVPPDYNYSGSVSIETPSVSTATHANKDPPSLGGKLSVYGVLNTDISAVSGLGALPSRLSHASHETIHSSM